MPGLITRIAQLQQVAADPSQPALHRAQAVQALRDIEQGGGQKMSLWNVYYSACRVGWVVSGVGPYTYTLNQGTELRPFSYAFGDDLTQANVGYPSGYGSATFAETNIITKGQTVAGEELEIYGVSAYFSADSDPYLLLKTIENASLTIAMNGGQQQYRLGRLAFVPGAGGVSGAGQSQILTPPQTESYARGVGALVNGIPSVQNFLPLPQPLRWKSAGSADSSLYVAIRIERTLTETATARAAVAGGASTPGTAAFSPPTSTGTYGTWVGIVLRLHSRQVSDRSVNM